MACWIRPNVAVAEAEKIVIQAWQKAPDRVVLASQTLAAVAFLDSMDLQPDCSMRNVTLYKQTALKEVTRRLRSTATAASDETITCLRNIVSFEVGVNIPASLRDADLHVGGYVECRCYRTFTRSQGAARSEERQYEAQRA